jgi:hypothetical protein
MSANSESMADEPASNLKDTKHVLDVTVADADDALRALGDVQYQVQEPLSSQEVSRILRKVDMW